MGKEKAKISVVKSLPAIQDMLVQSLVQEDPLEKEMVTQSGTLARKIPWTEELGGLQSMGPQRVGQECRDPTTTMKWEDAGAFGRRRMLVRLQGRCGGCGHMPQLLWDT